MALRLNKSVVAGGVVYPAGTAATPELREVIADRHWAGDESVDTAAFEQAIAERDAKIDVLEAELSQLRARCTQSYAKWRKADLEAEVAERNEGRTEDTRIVLPGGNVEDLVAALVADDAGAES